MECILTANIVTLVSKLISKIIKFNTRRPLFTRSEFLQLRILQFFISKLLPSQTAPPFIGFGELHSRLLYF